MKLAGVAQETLAIVGRGSYEAPSGKTVDIGHLVDAAVKGTRLYRPGSLDAWEPASAREAPPRIEVTAETTAEAARRLAQAEGITKVAVLNFASAKNPGGGFMRGAKAQEEDLARCSALYTCQLTQPAFYDANRATSSMLYTDHLIYSPDVPFFRDDRMALLEKPFMVSVITSPAPNAGEALRREGGARPRIQATLERRAAMVLAAAAANNNTTLVLGAWGCGVFKNEPSTVADVFARSLENPRFARAFDRIVFAIYDRSEAKSALRAFEQRFSAGGPR